MVVFTACFRWIRWLLVGGVMWLSINAPQVLHAQQPYFRNYNVDHGLLHNTVQCIMQDSYGFIWIGTHKGLNRFDGRTFRAYTLVDHEVYLGGNTIYTICEDNNKQLWIGTSQGVYRYNQQIQDFERFTEKTAYHVSISTDVKAIVQASDGQFWFGTSGQGLFRFRPSDGLLIQDSKHTAFVEHIAEDLKYKRMFVASVHEGLQHFSLQGGYLHAYSANGSRFGTGEISFLSYLGDKIWFGLSSNRIGVLDDTDLVLFEHPNTTMGVVRCASVWEDGSLLLGADKGLFTFDVQHGHFDRYSDSSDETHSTTNQMINAILVDREQGLWLGTYLDGLRYRGPQMIAVDHFVPTNERGGLANVINEFCEDGNGTIYVGTQEGLFKLPKGAMQLLPVPVGTTWKLDISALLLDGDDLWIGTKGEGISVLNLTSQAVRQFFNGKDNKNTINSNEITDLYKDPTGTIFVGTSLGLCRYNRKTDSFNVYSFAGAMIAVTQLLEDANQELWMATDNAGVFCINTQHSLKYQHYFRQHGEDNEICSNSVTALREGRGGKIWIGTNGNGLCYFDPAVNRFVKFDPEQSVLTNQVIYAIEEDESGYLWLSTNEGLIRVNNNRPSDFQQLTKADGLQDNQFSLRASLNARDGLFYFGGTNGFNGFSPEDAMTNEFIPPVYVVGVSGLTDGNESAFTVTDAAYLLGEVVLPYHHNSLSFSFAALSYQRPEMNRYRYYLDGLDDDWKLLLDGNEVQYNNLPPGDYVLKVLGSNNNAVWNKQPAELRFTITTPWWQTVWAYVGYVVLIGGGITGTMRRLLNRQKQRYQKSLIAYKEKKERDVYQSKIKFFINLVHEIRTPLTLISVPLQRLLDAKSTHTDQQRFLGIMDRNVNYLLGIVNELLDFQKIENATPQLHKRNHDINAILTSMKDHFEGFSVLRDISITLATPEDPLVGYVDKEALQKILYNLIGNAIKHTDKAIEITLVQQASLMTIEVKDDGPGVPTDDRETIFEAFQQLGDGTMGTGVGLFYSKLLADAMGANISVRDNEWGGATFSLRMPLESHAASANAVPLSIDPLVAAPNPSAEDTLPGNRKIQLLLVEDNLELLRVFEDSLNDVFTVITASDGYEALEVLEKSAVDVVVSDVMMPRMDGLTLSHAIKSSIDFCHIPVILLTAKTTVEAKEEGLTSGADVYLDKPVSLKQLKQQVKNLMKLKHHLQQRIQDSPYAAELTHAISKRDNAFLAKLHEEIDARIADIDFSIDELADMQFMSRSNFYRKIKSLTGMAPNNYLRAVRLKKAAYLLVTEDARINEVYEQVGFSSSSYFAKCFREQYQCTPREYIRKHKATQTP